MRFLKYLLIILISILIIFSCKKKTAESNDDSDYIFTATFTKDKLPDDLVWLTNDTDPVFASSEAKKGGVFRSFIPSFPNTFRTVGPDSNNSFASYIDANVLGLVSLHPNTENIIPALATHWAYGKDNKTMYFKLNKNARWSDGKPVTAHDFAYTFEFLRSKYIVQPYYNEVFAEDRMQIKVFDDYTIAIINKESKVPTFDLWYHTNIWPTPRHFYGKLDENFVEKYNWKIAPNTGPYNISEFKKGKYIVFKKNKDWWAKDLKYFENRFNVDKVRFDVISEVGIAWEYFKNKKLDAFGLNLPEYWHDKSNIDIFKNGYADKIWFFIDTKQPPYGLYLNQDFELFKDKNLRYAFAHAINIDKVIKTILRNDYYRLEHGFIGYGKYTNNNIKARKYDIEKVEYYMKKSGWNRGDDGIWQKNGKRFSVELCYSGDYLTERFVVLKEEAQKAGIEIRLNMLDSAAQYKKVIEKKYEVTYWAWTTKFRPVYFQQYLSEYAHKPQTNNITNTDDKDLDELINKYRYSFEEKDRIKYSLMVQEKLYEICPMVPLYMVPYVRQGYWRWWRFPEVPGTKNSDSIFDPFGDSTGGLFWYDDQLYMDTLKAMKKKIKFDPVTIIDKTYMMEILKKNQK